LLDWIIEVANQNQEILNLFQSTGAYLKGHFRLTSGLHSPEYLQCALVLAHPDHAESLGRRLAEALASIAPERPNLVVSPAMGGLIIGHEVARALGVRHIFTERDPERKMTLRRGFSVQPGDKVAVIEDVITTGGSTAEVVALLESHGAKVLAAGSIIDRSGGTANVGVPRTALATLEVQTWDPSACPLCAQGLEVVKPGSRPV
jgi:orotate phosphoribosyltransferase